MLQSEKRYLHIYCGPGKGKTTAAMGLAMRASGAGWRILVIQFLKDGTSSELKILRSLPGVAVVSGKAVAGFSSNFSAEERGRVRRQHDQRFEEALRRVQEDDIDLLILDEIIGAMNNDLVDSNMLMEFLEHRPNTLEVVLTGRDPSPKLCEMADYVSEISKIKHPFDQGILARVGVEK